MGDQGSVVLERFGAVASVSGAVLLAISVFFDFNFLLALGIRFREVPTGIADHVRTALVWLPQFLVSLAIVAMLQLFFGRASAGGTRFAFWLGRVVRITVFGGVAVVGVYTALTLQSNSWVHLTAILAWLALSDWVLAHDLFRKSFSRAGRLLFIGAPALVIMVGLFGYLEGERVLNERLPRFEAIVRLGDRVETMNLRGARRFEETALLIDMDRRVWVVPSEAVLSIKTMQPRTAIRSLSCRWVGWECAEEK